MHLHILLQYFPAGGITVFANFLHTHLAGISWFRSFTVNL